MSSGTVGALRRSAYRATDYEDRKLMLAAATEIEDLTHVITCLIADYELNGSMSENLRKLIEEKTND